MLFSDFKSIIPKLQVTPLGGVEAQFLLAPSYRKSYDLEKIRAIAPTKAAVLIIVFPNQDKEACVVLTERAAYDGHHAKQISFPGGKQEKADSSLLTTAIRETKEEIGLDILTSAQIKTMTDVFIPPSGFLVTPYLVLLDSRPKFSPNYEVNTVLTPKLTDLLDPNSMQIAKVQSTDNKEVDVPCFVLSQKHVWGATAMMLSEFKELLLQL